MNNKENEKCQKCTSLFGNIYKLLYTFIVLYAVYLSFKCNQKFNFLSFLIAAIFSPIYILYILIFKKNCNN
jgi:hypothetical protein